MNFKGKYATVAFDESVISAQEVARAISDTPHMMGRSMQYGGALLLSVAGVNTQSGPLVAPQSVGGCLSRAA